MPAPPLAVLVLALVLVGGAAAYNDDFGNTFGSKADCLEWWGTYHDACSAEEDSSQRSAGGEQPAPDQQSQWPIAFAGSPGTITLTDDDGSSETMQASDEDSSPE